MRTRCIRVQTPGSRWRAEEARAEADRAAGIADREDPDQRKPWPIDIDAPGASIHWDAIPRRGYSSYRVVDRLTGKVVMCGPPKAIGREIVRRLPLVLGLGNIE